MGWNPTAAGLTSKQDKYTGESKIMTSQGKRKIEVQGLSKRNGRVEVEAEQMTPTRIELRGNKPVFINGRTYRLDGYAELTDGWWLIYEDNEGTPSGLETVRRILREIMDQAALTEVYEEELAAASASLEQQTVTGEWEAVEQPVRPGEQMFLISQADLARTIKVAGRKGTVA